MHGICPFYCFAFFGTMKSVNAWNFNSTSYGIKELIIRSSKKCGLSVAIDASKNAQVSTDGIPNYQMPQPFVEEEFVRYVDEICGWTRSGCPWHRQICWWNNEMDIAVNEKRKAWKQWGKWRY